MITYGNYCGPQSTSNLGPGIDWLDEICKEHDEFYEYYLEKGANPYIYYNDADELLINRVKAYRGKKTWNSRLVAKIAVQYFENKRKVAKKLPEEIEPEVLMGLVQGQYYNEQDPQIWERAPRPKKKYKYETYGDVTYIPNDPDFQHPEFGTTEDFDEKMPDVTDSPMAPTLPPARPPDITHGKPRRVAKSYLYDLTYRQPKQFIVGESHIKRIH